MAGISCKKMVAVLLLWQAGVVMAASPSPGQPWPLVEGLAAQIERVNTMRPRERSFEMGLDLNPTVKRVEALYRESENSTDPMVHLRLACLRNVDMDRCPNIGQAYWDKFEGLQHLQRALAAAQQMGARKWNKTCKENLRKFSVSGTDIWWTRKKIKGCPWTEKDMRQVLSHVLSSHWTDRAAKIVEEVRDCLSSGCTDGEFTVHQPDLAQRLFDKGREYETQSRMPTYAMAWYELAAAQGHAGAAYLLAYHYARTPSGGLRDLEKAMHFAYLAGANVAKAEGRADVIGDPDSYAGLAPGFERPSVETLRTLPVQVLALQSVLELLDLALDLGHEGALDADQLFRISSMVEARYRWSTPVDKTNALLLMAAERGHPGAALGRYTSLQVPLPADSTPEQVREHDVDLEHLLEQALEGYARSPGVIEREQFETTLLSHISHLASRAETATTGGQSEYYREREMYWLKAGAKQQWPQITARYAMRLGSEPPPGYEALFRRDTAAALALLQALSPKDQQLPMVQDAVLSIRDPAAWQQEQARRTAERLQREQQQRAAAAAEERRREQAAAEERQVLARLQRAYVEHIDRYGPDTSDLGSFSYDVEVYCAYGGSRCNALRNQARALQRQINTAASREQMARAWSGVGVGGISPADRARAEARKRCIREAVESTKRARGTGNPWAYSVESCNR